MKKNKSKKKSPGHLPCRHRRLPRIPNGRPRFQPSFLAPLLSSRLNEAPGGEGAEFVLKRGRRLDAGLAGLAGGGVGDQAGLVGVAESAALAERIKRDVFVGAGAFGGDGVGEHGAIEDPPLAFVFPHEPGMAEAGAAVELADDEADVLVAELVHEPEGFVLAVAAVAGGGLLGESRDVGLGVGVAESATLAHEGIDAVEGEAFAVDVVEDLFDRGHVAVVGSIAGDAAEVDDGRRSGEFDGQEEGRESEELFAASGG